MCPIPLIPLFLYCLHFPLFSAVSSSSLPSCCVLRLSKFLSEFVFYSAGFSPVLLFFPSNNSWYFTFSPALISALGSSTLLPQCVTWHQVADMWSWRVSARTVICSTRHLQQPGDEKGFKWLTRWFDFYWVADIKHCSDVSLFHLVTNILNPFIFVKIFQNLQHIMN